MGPPMCNCTSEIALRLSGTMWLQFSRAKRPHSRGADRPRFASSFALLENRGRREGRVLAAPAVSRAICAKENAHEHTGSAETLRPSLRNGFTAYFVLSPVNGFLATVAPTKHNLVKLSASTAASGPHDLMSRRFFGLLKTAEASENKGIFRCLPDERKARRKPPGPDRP